MVREIFELYLAQKSAVMVAGILNWRKRRTKRRRANNGNVRGGNDGQRYRRLSKVAKAITSTHWNLFVSLPRKNAGEGGS